MKKTSSNLQQSFGVLVVPYLRSSNSVVFDGEEQIENGDWVYFPLVDSGSNKDAFEKELETIREKARAVVGDDANVVLRIEEIEGDKYEVEKLFDDVTYRRSSFTEDYFDSFVALADALNARNEVDDYSISELTFNLCALTCAKKGEPKLKRRVEDFLDVLRNDDKRLRCVGPFVGGDDDSLGEFLKNEGATTVPDVWEDCVDDETVGRYFRLQVEGVYFEADCEDYLAFDSNFVRKIDDEYFNIDNLDIV